MDVEDYKNFLNINILDYHNTSILGLDNFSEPLKNLHDNIKILIDESIRIILDNSQIIPLYLKQSIDDSIIKIKGFLSSIDSLVEKWPSNSDQNQRSSLLQQRNNLVNSINQYIQGVIWGRNDQGVFPSNFLSIIALIKTYDKRTLSVLNDYDAKKSSIEDKLKVLDDKSSYLDKSISDAEIILDNLRTEAAKKVVYNYSNIFLEEAENHSHYNKENKENKYGIAEKWLRVGIISTTLLLAFVLIMYFLFPIENNKIDYQLIVTKISIISILIFIITFSFKQYSINKHLYTLNKHRENVLNSYQLFLTSVKEDESNIRNVLMLEVAKAIYEQGKTGFINEKDNDSSSPSIIEFAKYLPKEKSS